MAKAQRPRPAPLPPSSKSPTSQPQNTTYVKAGISGTAACSYFGPTAFCRNLPSTTPPWLRPASAPTVPPPKTWTSCVSMPKPSGSRPQILSTTRSWRRPTRPWLFRLMQDGTTLEHGRQSGSCRRRTRRATPHAAILCYMTLATAMYMPTIASLPLSAPKTLWS